MGTAARGVGFGVVGPEKCGTLRWPGQVIRRNEDGFVKRVYQGKNEGESTRRRTPEKLNDSGQVLERLQPRA